MKQARQKHYLREWNQMREHEQYVFLNVEPDPQLELFETDDYQRIQIIDGVYSGIVYHYGKLKAPSVNEKTSESLKLEFEYTIDQMNDNVIFDDPNHKAEEFIHYIGEILTSIIIGKEK